MSSSDSALHHWRQSRDNSAKLFFLILTTWIPGGYCQLSNPGTAVPDVRDRNLFDPQTDGAVTFIRKFAVNVALDQKAIWISPFRMNKAKARRWAVIGAGTAVLLAFDHRVSQQLPDTGTSERVGNDFSKAGQWYSVYPFAGAAYFLGLGFHDENLSKTGALSLEALTDAAILVNVLKVAAGRERPLSGDGGGHFEKGEASFPSGHLMEAWALASVVAKRYGNHRWVPLVSYAYASAVSLARISSRQHFPSDVLAGRGDGIFYWPIRCGQ
jgi:membrane-associated phospholipid phosphatase